ncbi:MAG: hypothetical protein IKV03_06820, partial [Alphaproteobacteria bacterium]|nr:hypothetical protein [Alphaproteobacteria bacterium]
MKIFSNHISESTLVKNILQHIETKKNFKLRDSYTYVFNNTHIVKIPFTPQTVKSLQQEIKISKILQKHQLPAQTVAWQQINLSSTPSLNIPFCAVSQRIEGYHPSSLEDPLLQSDLGRFFAKLHKISASEFQDVSTYMDTLFQHTIRTWEQLNKHKGI